MDRADSIRCPHCGQVKRVEDFPRAYLAPEDHASQDIKFVMDRWGRIYYSSSCKKCKRDYLRTNTAKLLAKQQRRGRILRFLAWKEATSA